jgi:hypothetical protein
LRRDSTALPFPAHNPGALIGRVVDVRRPESAPHSFFAGRPCRVQAVPDPPGIGQVRASPKLGLGSNDHRYAGVSDFGVGMYTVTLAWLPAGRTAGTPCPARETTHELLEAAMRV